jgi:hypothetical protein
MSEANENALDMIRKLVDKHPHYCQLGRDLRDILATTPAYQFPTGLGAVVEGTFRNGGGTDKFTYAASPHTWIRESSGFPWNQHEIRESLTNLRTLSGGVEL